MDLVGRCNENQTEADRERSRKTGGSEEEKEDGSLGEMQAEADLHFTSPL